MRSKLLALALGVAVAAPVFGAANIIIFNFDGPGEGLNDPTPVAPVGGNPATTLGGQRQNVFLQAAQIWGAKLDSTVTIRVIAQFNALSCSATSAVLGSAGTINIFSFPGVFPGIVPNHWYHDALFSKLAGFDVSGVDLQDPFTYEIFAQFNSNLGQANCLAGAPFYLGLDNNHGAAVDLLTVVLHELAHGLGFSSFFDETTGQNFAGLPGIYDKFAFDPKRNKHWNEMNDAERFASVTDPRNTVWDGANVKAAVPNVLLPGVAKLQVAGTAAGAAAGDYLIGPALFGPPLNTTGVMKDIMPVVDSPGGIGLACNPLSAANALAVNGNIALVDRGTCGFTTKVKNAQNAGAVGVIVADNAAGSPPAALGGADPTITIPAIRITQADGVKLKNALRRRSRTRSGVIGKLFVDLAQRAGADLMDRPFLFTPNPAQPGSSASHWDTSATRNLLMEPGINADLTHSVMAPEDLTREMFADLGWFFVAP